VLRTLLKRHRQRWAGLDPCMKMTSLEDAMCEAKAFPPAMNASQINNILNIFLWYTESPSKEEVVASAGRLLELKRFRAVPLNGGWRLHPTKADDHVSIHNVSSETQAVDLLQGIAQMQELPRDQALWSVDVAHVADGSAVALFRIHHVIGDGVGLCTEMIPQICTNLKGQPVTVPIPALPKHRGGLVANLLWYVDAFRSVGKIVSAAVKPMETELPFIDPERPAYSNRRSIVFFPTISLDFVRQVKDAAKCTVNDVMFTAWAGAMRKYSVAHGFSFEQECAVARSVMAVAVPRSFPEGHDPQDRLTNNFALVPVDLEINSSDPKTRLSENKANLDAVKKTTIAPVSLWFTNVIVPLLPVFMQQQTARDVFARHSLVFSNVPGPKEEFCVFGKHVDKFQCAFLNVAPQVLAISCVDKIFMNVTADPEVAKGLQEQFPAFFCEELEELGRAYGVEGHSRHGTGPGSL